MELGCNGDITAVNYYIMEEFGRVPFVDCPELPFMIDKLGEIIKLLKAYGCTEEDFKGLYFKKNNFYITFSRTFYEDLFSTEKGEKLLRMIYPYSYYEGDREREENQIHLSSEGLFLANKENVLYYLDHSLDIFRCIKVYKDFENYVKVNLERSHDG